MSRFPIFLRVDRGTWANVQAETMPRRVVTVVAAFALSAWNRFGAQAALGPRSPMRMILTGIYGWLALTLLIWLIARSRSQSDERSQSHDEGTLWSLQRAGAAVAVAHFPLIILSFYMATFGAFIRTPIPGTILAVAVFAVWIPVLLVRAMQHLIDVERPMAFGLIVIPYLLWLAWIGRYLFFQVGHLL